MNSPPPAGALGAAQNGDAGGGGGVAGRGRGGEFALGKVEQGSSGSVNKYRKQQTLRKAVGVKTEVLTGCHHGEGSRAARWPQAC